MADCLEGRVDLVAFGRYFTSNPDLARRILEDIAFVEYERKTFYTPGMEGYLGWAKAKSFADRSAFHVKKVQSSLLTKDSSTR